MTDFRLHQIDSAPAGSAEALRALEQGLGFVPNLAATMAESPVLVSGFVDLRKTLAGSELSGVEREIVALAVSLENVCDYCMAAHSTFALMQQADEEAVAAARQGREPEDPKLAALYGFARSLVTKRGHVDKEETQALLDAGYSRRCSRLSHRSATRPLPTSPTASATPRSTTPSSRRPGPRPQRKTPPTARGIPADVPAGLPSLGPQVHRCVAASTENHLAEQMSLPDLYLTDVLVRPVLQRAPL